MTTSQILRRHKRRQRVKTALWIVLWSLLVTVGMMAVRRVHYGVWQ